MTVFLLTFCLITVLANQDGDLHSHESPSIEVIKMQRNNKEKFDALRKWQLPINQYVIIGSGPLGIRNIKTIGDIDILVSPELWATLVEKYGIADENGIRKIVFPDGIVEAFGEGSFYSFQQLPQDPALNDRIKNAEIMEGLPFDTLENVLYYKRKQGREKDLKDIYLIEQWMKTKKS